MIVLADNDILLKLARCDLFGEFLAVFDVTASDVRILKATRYSVTSKKYQKRIGDVSFTRLLNFLGQVPDVSATPDPTAILALNEQTDKNIDAGEAALFATCPLVPDSIIVTGDKRSLAGLAAAAAENGVCEGLCQSLAGRLICFELVMTRIVDLFGFEAVRQKLIDGRECDGGLAIWLGSGLEASEHSFRDGLASFLNNVRQTSGALLAIR